MNIKKITFITLTIGAILCATPSLAGSCKKQGSSYSIAAITSRYKNCVNCGTQMNGNKTVYYCYCGDGCKGSSTSKTSSKIEKVANNKEKTTSKRLLPYNSDKVSGSCTKQGSHDSINYLKRHYKNCTKCWSEDIAAGKCSKNKKAHKHYYCNCGDGCLKKDLQRISK